MTPGTRVHWFVKRDGRADYYEGKVCAVFWLWCRVRVTGGEIYWKDDFLEDPYCWIRMSRLKKRWMP